MNPQLLFSAVSAGNPHPTDERGELFDLAGHLIQNPGDTFYVKVAGNSMNESGIFDGDILVVDRAVEPRPQDVVVADAGDGQYTVKQFKRERDRLRLVPSNPAYQPIDITEETRVCGVARFTIHRL